MDGQEKPTGALRQFFASKGAKDKAKPPEQETEKPAGAYSEYWRNKAEEDEKAKPGPDPLADHFKGLTSDTGDQRFSTIIKHEGRTVTGLPRSPHFKFSGDPAQDKKEGDKEATEGQQPDNTRD